MRTALAFILALFIFTAPAPAFAEEAKPIKILIITGDHGHDWKKTTPFLKQTLADAGMDVDVTETPAKDLLPGHLDPYDVLLLNYKDTPAGGPDTLWSAKNKRVFADAVESGKGLFVYHHASSAFIGGDDWDKQFEKIIAGGWRKQGFHGNRHEYSVTITPAGNDHPITKGLPHTFPHNNDELYQNSLIPEGSTILATAFSDPKKDKKNTGKDEPMVWVATYGKGRVCNNALGHDVPAMSDANKGFQTLLIRGVQWCATGEVKYPLPEELKGKEK